MMKVLLLSMLFACNVGSQVDDIQIKKIIVKKGWSYKIDLEKETYTVYFMNGTSYDCKFTLSDKEKSDITEMARACGLTKLKGNVQVEDKCQINPVVITQLLFSAGENNVQVSVDESCDKHPLFKGGESKRILQFLKFLHDRISTKPEVAKAPKTDVRYH